MTKELISQSELKNKTVVALGKFESLHKGHAELFSKTVEIASLKDASSVVYTIKIPGSSEFLSHEQKIALAKEIGIDAMFEDELTTDYKHMTPSEFVKKILVEKFNACHVVVGYNFTFGYKKSGTAQILKELCHEFNIGVTVVDCVYANIDDKSVPVSTTDIRTYLSEGRVDCAFKLLGRPYSIKGVVSEGKHLGTALGFPTANLVFPKESMVLKKGVYLTNTLFDGKTFKSITNVGINPTVDINDGNIKIETYILNFSEEIYEKEITVEFISFLRNEKNFENIDKLKEQLFLDIETAKNNL